MRLLKKDISILFLISCLALMTISLRAQETETDVTSVYLALLSEDLDTSFIDFLKEEVLLEKIELKSILPFESLRKVIGSTDSPSQKIWQPTLVTLQMLRMQGLGIDSTDIWYKQLSANSGVKLMGVPVKILSAVSVNFDAASFLNQLKPSFQQNPKKLIANPSKFLQLPEQKLLPKWSEKDLSVLKNEIKFQLYQQIISHPKFIQLLEKKDSIQWASNALKDNVQYELTNAKLNAKQKTAEAGKELEQLKSDKLAAIDSLEKEQMEKAATILKEYNQKWEERKTYFGDTLRALHQKIDRFAKLYDEYNQPEKLKRAFLKNENTSGLQKFLAISEQISIGQSILDDSWFTANQMPINGFQYRFDDDRLFGGVAIGKQRFHTRHTPIWTLSLW